ncbi:MAG: recombinase family protein [Oscillospiraceae bacterium]
MAENRRIPYGYQIQNGAITLHSEETEIVRRIYRDYVSGKSYKAIADMLTAEGVRYMPEKPQWNKNMVARILLNESYMGTQKYPVIVEEALYKAADTAKKPYKIIMILASGHACSITGPLILMVYFIGWKCVLPCLALFALIIWASLNLKRHTPKELITGSFSAVIAFAISLLIVLL